MKHVPRIALLHHVPASPTAIALMATLAVALVHVYWAWGLLGMLLSGLWGGLIAALGRRGERRLTDVPRRPLVFRVRRTISHLKLLGCALVPAAVVALGYGLLRAGSLACVILASAWATGLVFKTSPRWLTTAGTVPSSSPREI